MQQITRFTLALFLIAMPANVIDAKTDTKPTVTASEYKRSDTNFYWKGDVLKAYPDAVIIQADGYTLKSNSYFITSKKTPPKEIYIQVINDWLEPVTPPDMPASLGIAPDAMQIREPQGDVQVALPTAPANFVPATDGMTIPNGTVVKTGANGTAAVLMGGVDSARLIPNSEAAVQQTVTPQLRSTEIDLTVGAVFSKVGQRVGEKQDYKVHTPFGVAAARGTDFVAIAMPARTDVWIAQGTVQLDQPDGKMVGAVKAEGTGALKIVRFPVMTDPHQAMMAGAETMTAAMNFIPMANQKVKALRSKMASGGKLSAKEQDYMNRIKKVPCLIKLALVEPVPVTPPPAPASVPAPAPKLVTVPVPAKPAAPPAPLKVVAHADGKVLFQGKVISLDEFKSKLEVLTKATPDQPLVIKAGKNVPYEKIKALIDLCAAEQVKSVTFEEPMPKPPAPTPAPAASATTNAAPAPAAEPAVSPASPAATTAPAEKPPIVEKKSSPKPSSAPPPASGPNDTVP